MSGCRDVDGGLRVVDGGLSMVCRWFVALRRAKTCCCITGITCITRVPSPSRHTSRMSVHQGLVVPWETEFRELELVHSRALCPNAFAAVRLPPTHKTCSIAIQSNAGQK